MFHINYNMTIECGCYIPVAHMGTYYVACTRSSKSLKYNHLIKYSVFKILLSNIDFDRVVTVK